MNFFHFLLTFFETVSKKIDISIKSKFTISYPNGKIIKNFSEIIEITNKIIENFSVIIEITNKIIKNFDEFIKKISVIIKNSEIFSHFF